MSFVSRFSFGGALKAGLLLLLWAVPGVTPGTMPAAAQNWMRIEALPGEFMYALATSGDTLVAATDRLVYLSTDGGGAWEPGSSLPDTTVHLASVLLHAGRLYTGTIGGGVFASDDLGETWTPMSTGLAGWARNVAAMVVRGETLYAGTDGAGIYAMDLQAPLRWVGYNDGLSVYGTNALAVSGDVLVASLAMYGNSYVRSPDAEAWEAVPFDAARPSMLATDFQVVGPWLFAATSGGLYRGGLDAHAWEHVALDLFPGRAVALLARQGNRLHAAIPYLGEHFIAETDDFGLTWRVHTHEFAQLLDMQVSGDRIWAARTDGLWYRQLGPVLDAEEPALPGLEEIALDAPYPNPFTRSITLPFRLSDAGPVALHVYDVTGRRVRTLFEGVMTSGTHEVALEATGLPGGVYLIRLQTGRGARSRPVTLIP